MKLEKGMTVYRVFNEYYGGSTITGKYLVTRCTEKSAWFVSINNVKDEKRAKRNIKNNGHLIVTGERDVYTRYSFQVANPELDDIYEKQGLGAKYEKHLTKLGVDKSNIPFDYLELMYLYSNLSEEKKKEIKQLLKK